MMVEDIIARIRLLWKDPKTKEMLMYAYNRGDNVQDGDVWSGRFLRTVSREIRKRVLFFSWSNDAAVFQSSLNKSFSPLVAALLNAPPHLRHRFGLMFLMGMLPPSVKDYNKVYTAFFEHFSDLGCFEELGGEGLVVTDCDGVEEVIHLKFIRKVLSIYQLLLLPAYANISSIIYVYRLRTSKDCHLACAVNIKAP